MDFSAKTTPSFASRSNTGTYTSRVIGRNTPRDVIAPEQSVTEGDAREW